MNERMARGVGPDRIDLAYERQGRAHDPCVLLVMGIAAQAVSWPDGFLHALLERDLQVVRFDNRDSGHSTHLTDAPAPDLPAVLGGDLRSASYRLAHLAADAIGLLDALGIQAAHVVGASMGGAIAQTLALQHPDRIRSLTSMMSTTGDPSVGQAHPATLRKVFGGGQAHTREAFVAQRIAAHAVVGSPGYPTPVADVEARAGLLWDRDHDPVAIARQAVAVVASGDRTQALGTLDVPTLVVHGLDDTMCDPSGGRAVAGQIAGARLLEVPGMGHDLPPRLWDRIADAIAEVVRRGEASAPTG